MANHAFTNDGCGHPVTRFHLPLIQPVGSGATGVLYSGYAHPYTTSTHNTALAQKLVFKIAVDEEQCVRLRHEANMYVRMQGDGVKGIPHFYGLFEESSPLGGASASLGMLVSFVSGSSFAALGDRLSISAMLRYATPLLFSLLLDGHG